MTLRIGLESGAEDAAQRAAAVLNGGGIAVVPTESFYCLAARPDDPLAVARVAALKGRDADKPIALIAGEHSDASRVGTIGPALVPLVKVMWPGPLTVVLPADGRFPAPVAGPDGTVGVRVPDHFLARTVARAAGGLITATSANLSGRPPVIAVADVDAEIVAGVDAVVEAGATLGGRPSTLVIGREDGVAVLREGAISVARIEEILGRAVMR